MAKRSNSTFPWGELIGLLFTVFLLVFTKLDYITVGIVFLEGLSLGISYGRNPQHFKRYIFWRKNVSAH